MSYTKGKWEIKKFTIGNVESENGRYIANCMGYSTNMDKGEHVQENLANAKLISAAPELLEALKQAQLGIENMSGWEELDKHIKKVIKKAES